MKKTSVIGVVVPSLTNLFFPTIVEAIDKVIHSNGYTLSLNSTSGDAELERDLVNKIMSMQVDGIIVIDPAVENLDIRFYKEVAEQLPVIIVNANSPRQNLNYVSYNEEIGTTEAFEYLIKLGHQRIAFLRGESSFSYDLKENIYLDIADKNELDYEHVIRIKHGNSIEGAEESKEEVMKLINSKERPTAIFACNDLMAVGVMSACNDLGLKIPEDMSIIGFDNTLLSKISHPKLTTVDLKMEEVGRKAAEKMLDVIDNKESRRVKVVLNTSLIVRDSCAAVTDLE